MHVLGALGRGGPAPGALVQSPAGGLDGAVDVGIGAQRSGAEGLAGGGLQRAVRVGAEWVDPLAVDEEPCPVQVGVSVSGDGHGHSSENRQLIRWCAPNALVSVQFLDGYQLEMRSCRMRA